MYYLHALLLLKSYCFALSVYQEPITLPNNENVSGSKLAYSYVFPPAEFKNHHKK
jgi:hypothetical protein